MNSRDDTPLFSLTHWHDIAHYYGDYVRMFFLGTAALSFVAIPVFGNVLPFGTLVQVSAGLLLVLLAGLTHPHSRMLQLYDAAVAGLGVLLLESAAISFYSIDSVQLFAVREASALMLLFAFYYSIKTLRAMSLGKVGQEERPWEFEETKE